VKPMQRSGGSIYYLFDFDEEWEHAIEIRDINDKSLAGESVVIAKQGDAPSHHPDRA
jgi:hypothetical protein